MSSISNVVRVPRETIEFQTIEILLDGVPVSTGLEVSMAPDGSRPTTWTAMEVRDGKTGFMIQGMAPGEYGIWVRHTGADQAVRFAGALVVY